MKNYVIGIFAALFLTILFIWITRSRVSQDTGYFTATYDSSTEQKKYGKYINNGCSFWSDILNNSHSIKLSIKVYYASNSSTIASASISKVNSKGLATSGIININSPVFDNISSSAKYNTIKHEIGHVLGIGYWKNTAGSGTSSRISGTAYPTALSEFNSLTDASFTIGVPIESSGGAGTIGAHWENNYRSNFASTGSSSKGLTNELMAGYIGTTAFLSGVTLGYLKDIGWDLDLSKKDPKSKFVFDLSAKTGLEVKTNGGCGVCTQCGK